jgi:hypothetical protein
LTVRVEFPKGNPFTLEGETTTALDAVRDRD